MGTKVGAKVGTPVGVSEGACVGLVDDAVALWTTTEADSRVGEA